MNRSIRCLFAALALAAQLSAATQQACLRPAAETRTPAFGMSTAVDGNTLVVGAPSDESVYVYTRANGTWTQQAYLKAPRTGAFGSAVAVSGDTLVVGAYRDSNDADGNTNHSPGLVSSGAAYIFTRSGSAWTQRAYLKVNPERDGQFGWSVAASSDSVVVGAPGAGNGSGGTAYKGGAAYVFAPSGGLDAAGQPQSARHQPCRTSSGIRWPRPVTR
jgi:hypothetical protein